jgi:nucleotide-binding universal stress UspA family protein
LARKYGASIVVATVTNEDQDAEWIHDTPTRQKGINKSRNVEFKRIFLSLESLAKRFNIHFDSIILESNNTASSIISFASFKRVDYIVMGTHGEGKSKEMMMGRVSTSIALNAHCPVVLVK